MKRNFTYIRSVISLYLFHSGLFLQIDKNETKMNWKYWIECFVFWLKISEKWINCNTRVISGWLLVFVGLSVEFQVQSSSDWLRCGTLFMSQFVYFFKMNWSCGAEIFLHGQIKYVLQSDSAKSIWNDDCWFCGGTIASPTTTTTEQAICVHKFKMKIQISLMVCAYLIIFMHPNGTNRNVEKKKSKCNKSQLSILHRRRERERERMEHFWSARSFAFSFSPKQNLSGKNMIVGRHDEKAALCTAGSDDPPFVRALRQ